MKQATIIFKGFFADEIPYDDGLPIWEMEPHTGLFETSAEIWRFIKENRAEPYDIAIITEYEVTDIRQVDDQCVDFERWELK